MGKIMRRHCFEKREFRTHLTSWLRRPVEFRIQAEEGQEHVAGPFSCQNLHGLRSTSELFVDLFNDIVAARTDPPLTDFTQEKPAIKKDTKFQFLLDFV